MQTIEYKKRCICDKFAAKGHLVCHFWHRFCKTADSMKHFGLIIVFLWAGIGLAQAENVHYEIVGKVVSNTDGSALEMSTIRLFRYSGADSALVQGAQTDDEGQYTLRGIAAGQYKLYISNIGYKEQALNVNVSVRTAKDNVLTIKTVRLQEDVLALQEVSVQGHAAEMTVKGDTIEYNTSAYKVGENAMVEDLLKKMNGVTVDRQGNVTVNGESITAVRIDGKKFFGSDVQSATKNIPADMIEKIQVIDEKSDVAKMTGFEDDDTEHIINLTLKQDRKRGVFGKYTGSIGADMVTENGGWFNYGDPAYGSTSNALVKHFFKDDFRYNANLFTNILLGESQTTIIGSANNTNEVRMGRGRGGFGMDANSGITRSENIGVNTNVDFNDRIKKKDGQTSLLLGGDAAINHSANHTLALTQKESYAGDYTYLNGDSLTKHSRVWDVNVRLELQYQIDSLNKLLIQPTISYTGQSDLSNENYTYHRQDSLINDGYQTRLDSTREISGGLKLTYNHKFLRPGRALTLVGKVNYGNTTGVDSTYAFDNLDNLSLVNQYTNSKNDNLSYSLKVSYVEPIYKRNHLLEIAATFSGRNRNSTKDQYSFDTETHEYAFDSLYSNQLNNRFYSEQLELNYRWVTKNSDLTVGARVLASQTHTTTYYGQVLHQDTLINVWNWSPTVNFKYKFGKKEFARIRYRGTVSQPTITQMESVRNNSDAMNETVGNLGLQPAFSHNLMAMYSRFNQDKFSSIMTGIRATMTKDALVNNAIYDETGKLYQQTVNADVLPWNIGADLMYNTPFANKMLQFNTRTAISYNQRVAYILKEQKADEIARMIEEGNMILGDRSLTGNLQVNEDLGLRFTHDIVDIGLRANGTYSRTQNNLTQNSVSNVFNWGVTGDLEFHLPKSWNISTDCGYTARYGYTGLTDVNEIIWNASIDKTWSNATLSLEVYDILHQKKNIVQVVGENYVSYAKYNTLPTYFMLTFTYKLNKMGKLKASGMGGHIQEMIENDKGGKGAPPRGGMPPMGPPPGI